MHDAWRRKLHNICIDISDAIAMNIGINMDFMQIFVTRSLYDGRSSIALNEY